jgi:hypothetical protein
VNVLVLLLNSLKKDFGINPGSDLTITQTGMNQANSDFMFSLDNDRKEDEMYSKAKSTLE